MARASITSLHSTVGPSVPPPMVPIPPAPVQQQGPPINRHSSREVNDSGVPYKENNPFATSDAISKAAINEEPSKGEASRLMPSKRNSQPVITDEIKDEGEDTMQNLRKTFAGIFGDM